MRLVLDASVAAKLVLQETDSDQAFVAIRIADALAAPDLILTEIANTLLKAAGRGDFDALRVEEAVDTLRAACRPLVPASELLDEAIAIARVLRHPIYDCIYLALGRRLGAPVLTADAALVRACERSSAWNGAALLLSRASAVP